MNKEVVVMDIQPIDPSISGGRIRLRGLYSGFCDNVKVTYIGSYDWPGGHKRKLQLSACLTEIDIPLSELYFEEINRINCKLPGKIICDVAFPFVCKKTEELIQVTSQMAKKANIVVFSHPWLFPLVAEEIDNEKKLIVYDSQNFEGLLRYNLLDDKSGFGNVLSRSVVRAEYELCHAADLILACSDEDKDLFTFLYGIDAAKINVVPNGVSNSNISLNTTTEKAHAKKKLGLSGVVAVFIGSDYPPNIEAAKVLVEIAKKMECINFVIIGGAGVHLTSVNEGSTLKNLRITGGIEEKEKELYLTASDMALNPVAVGSGTNVKMFDYMAAKLPIVTTVVGARGIKGEHNKEFYICEIANFHIGIEKLANAEELRVRLGICAQKLVRDVYCWENISHELGYNLSRREKMKVEGKYPLFSIVIPTYERHDLLSVLVDQILLQSEKDFEVIIIDQSKETWGDLHKYSNIDILYFHTPVKGAVKARNTGIRLSLGDLVAFIDDDCIPDINWLHNAKRYFEDNSVVGVEGRIESTMSGNPLFREVTNRELEGIGYMTANLVIRKSILEKIKGFDEEFDTPHFREDTDLGWRTLSFGKVPFCEDVIVFHPPQKRSIERESAEERAKFFVHDPLLLKKHPDMYIDLFVREEHYKNIEKFWDYFIKGIEMHYVEPEVLRVIALDPRVDKVFVPSEFLDMLNIKRDGST